MNLLFSLTSYCDPSVIQKGSELAESKSLRLMPARTKADGNTVLRAKAVDSFNFVDHPQLVVNCTGKAILGYSCDCVEYRREKSFCPHCAALALAYGASKNTQKQVAADPQEEQPKQPIRPMMANEPGKEPELGCLSYAFCNSARDLYPGIEHPEIPLERYYYVYGKTAQAKRFYEFYRTWGGSCFGISATSSMLYQPDGGFTVGEFNASASFPWQLKLSDRSAALGLTLHELIEAVHITQYHSYLQEQEGMDVYGDDCLKELCCRVEKFQRGEGEPVCMGIWADPAFHGGHAVLPFRLEKINASMERLHIYDPNWPMQIRYADVTKDSAGNYINWRFPMFRDVVYSGDTGGQLSFNAYEDYKMIWDQRSGAAGSKATLMAAPGTAVTDAAGKMLARITSKGLVSNRDDIRQVKVTRGGALTEEGAIQIYLPAGCYVIWNEDPDQEVFRFTMSDVNQSAIVSTAAQKIQVIVDDSCMVNFVSIPDENCSFAIELDSTLENTLENAKLEGVTAEQGLCFAQFRGELFCTGLAENAQTVFTLNGQPAALEQLSGDVSKIFQNGQETVENEDEDQLHVMNKKQDKDEA